MLHRAPGLEGVDQADHVLSQFVWGTPNRFWSGRDEQGSGRKPTWPVSLQIGADRSQPTSQPVPHHRGSDLPGYGERHPYWRIAGSGLMEVNHRERARTDPQTVGSQRREGAAIADGPDQADSLARPFRRRFRKMARPARVDIR